MQQTSGLPFTSIGYKGGANQNGIPVVAQGVAPHTIGGILSTANTETGSSYGFGALMSRTPAAPNEFLYGTPTSGLAIGILQLDPGIAQNDPAHANYPLLGQPCAIGFSGSYQYNGWRKTVTGAIDPAVGCKVVSSDTTGELQFIPSVGSADGGWTVQTAIQVVNVDELGFNGVELSLSFA
jgi:hypothetical protein